MQCEKWEGCIGKTAERGAMLSAEDRGRVKVSHGPIGLVILGGLQTLQHKGMMVVLQL